MARRDKLRRMIGANDKGKPTKRPALPPADDEGFNDAVRETLEQLQGQRGDELDQAVTFRDLEDGALSKRMVERGIDAGAKIKVGVDDGAMVGGFDSRDDGMPRPTYPYEAENVEASAAYTRIILSWEIPRLGNYAYSEVYRAETDSVSEARLIGSTRSGIYTDVTGGGFTGYYWIRIVNDLGNRSGYSEMATATTPLDFDVIRDAATSRAWQKNHDYSIYNAVIPTTGVTYIGDEAVVFIAQSAGTSASTEPSWNNITAFGQIINDNGIQWKAVEAGKIPFMIDAETGLTVIEGAAIRKASIDALTVRDGFFDRMTADKGTLNEANISVANIFDAIVGGVIKSSNFDRGRYGFEIKSNGDAEFNDVTLRGALTNGTINALTKRISTGARYIDFRKGVYDEFGYETNGNFTLGDVEDDNYISFKYEPTAGKRILRVRGDIVFKELSAGGNLYLQNTSEKTGYLTGSLYIDKNKFAAGKKLYAAKSAFVKLSDGSNTIEFTPKFIDNYPNCVSLPMAFVGTSIPMVDDVLDFVGSTLTPYYNLNESKIVTLKENYVYGTGAVRLRVKVKHTRYTGVWITAALAVRRKDGSYFFIRTIPSVPAAHGNQVWVDVDFTQDVRINFGESIVLIPCGFMVNFHAGATNSSGIALANQEARFVRVNEDFLARTFNGARYQVQCTMFNLYIEGETESRAVK